VFDPRVCSIPTLPMDRHLIRRIAVATHFGAKPGRPRIRGKIEAAIEKS
jgi:hypothetical protein